MIKIKLALLLCILCVILGCNGKVQSVRFNGTVHTISKDVSLDIAPSFELKTIVTCEDIKDPNYCLALPIAFYSENYVKVKDKKLVGWINVTWSEIYDQSEYPKQTGELFYINDNPVYGYFYKHHLLLIDDSSLFQAGLRSLKEHGIQFSSDMFYDYVMSYNIDSKHRVMWSYLALDGEQFQEMTDEVLKMVLRQSLVSNTTIKIK